MLPYRRFTLTPGAATFGSEYDSGIIHTWAYFSLVGASLVDGADEACRAVAPYSLSLVQDTCDPQITEYTLARGIRPNTWTQRDYPIGYPPASGDAVFQSYLLGVGSYVNDYQAELFSQGIFFQTSNYEPGEPNVDGEKIESYITPSHVRVYYFNPVVSSFSHYALRTSEQVDFVITGLGFNQDNAEIDEGGWSYPAGWKSYVTEIEFWQVGLGAGDWEDDFEDGIREPAWSDEPNNGTIDEAGGVLTLAIANGVDGDWWQPNIEQTPFAKLSPAQNVLTVITKLNSYAVNVDTHAGLMIGSTTTIPDTAGGYCLSIARVRGAVFNGLAVTDMGAGTVASITPLTTLPIWLRLVIKGSGSGGTIDFDYSTDGEEWTTLYTKNNLTWSIVGLYVKHWGAKNGVSAPFEFFKYSWEAQSVSTLKLADGDFTLDSDTQITIPQSKFPEKASENSHRYSIIPGRRLCGCLEA